MRLSLAIDSRTQFPHVKVAGQNGWVSLLPLAKPQAEKFLWSGEAARRFAGDVRRCVALERRLLLLEEEGEYMFDRATVDVFARVRHENIGHEEGLLATNFEIQATEWLPGNGHAAKAPAKTPTKGTEAEMILSWLGAGGGAWLLSATERRALGEETARRTALEYLGAVLDSVAGLKVSQQAVQLLEVLYKRKERFRFERGLPFLENGIWELTSEARQIPVRTGSRDTRLHYRVIAAGRCRFMPTMWEGDDDERACMIEHHPAVGMRPVLSDAAMGPDRVEIEVLPEAAEA